MPRVPLLCPALFHHAAKGQGGAGGFPGRANWRCYWCPNPASEMEREREGLGLFTGIYHGGEVTLWYLGRFCCVCVCFLGWVCFFFFGQEVINAFPGIKIFPACLSCWCRKESSNHLTFLRDKKGFLEKVRSVCSKPACLFLTQLLSCMKKPHKKVSWGCQVGDVL